MANECYNMFSFYGNKKVIEQVKAWRESLANYPATEEDPHCMGAITEIFYPEIDDKKSIDLGSKWVHEDNSSLSPEDDQISLTSAWHAPKELQQRMACLLYKLDKHVVVENSFNIEDGTIGVAYASPYDDENAYFQDAVVELDSEGYDDISEAEDAAYDELKAAEIEILDFLMDDMEGTYKVIKKFKPHLKNKFTWSDYS